MSNDISTTGIFVAPFLLFGINKSILKSSLLLLIFLSFFFFFYVIFKFGLTSLLGELSRDIIYKELMAKSEEVGFSSAVTLTSITSFCIGYTLVYFLFLPLIAKNLGFRLYILIIIIAIVQLLLYQVLNQKRQIIVEFSLIYVFSLFLNSKLLPKMFITSRFVQLCFLAILFFFISSTEFYYVFSERFRENSNNLSEFDRFQEAREVLSEFDFVNYFIGNGFGWLATKAVSTGETVHIGYLNLFNKGGFLYLFFYLYQASKNIYYCYRKAKFIPEYSVGVAFSIFSIIDLSFTPGYGWYFTSIITGMAMFSRFFLDDLAYSEYSLNYKY
jgi:hypothetical protein